MYIYIYIGRESNKSVNLIYAMVTKDNRIAKLTVIRDFTYALTVYRLFMTIHYGKTLLSKMRET